MVPSAATWVVSVVDADAIDPKTIRSADDWTLIVVQTAAFNRPISSDAQWKSPCGAALLLLAIHECLATWQPLSASWMNPACLPARRGSSIARLHHRLTQFHSTR